MKKACDRVTLQNVDWSPFVTVSDPPDAKEDLRVELDGSAGGFGGVGDEGIDAKIAQCT
jgi:hypothetical protein